VALLAIVAAQGRAQGTGHAADAELKWGPAPAIFPAGAQMAVLQGNPGSTSLFTVRLRMPDGYKIPPHTHPTDEQVTVISGSFKVGMGAKMEPKEAMTLKAGGFVIAPANMAHFALTQGETIVQVHAMGPFAMTYVNAADTPKAATPR
jgi:quercetin dioxygenase-like cupin family protein